MGFESEPLGLQRNRPAAREGIEDRRRMPFCRLQDLGVGFGEKFFVLNVLPHDEALDQLVEALAFFALQLLGGKFLGMRGGVVDELREQHRAGGRERAASPPQMQGGGVAVPN